MADEPIQLPAACIEPTAKIMARRLKIFSVLPFFIGAFFLASEFGRHVQHGFHHSVFGEIFAGVILIVVPSSIGLWLVRKARRITRAGRLASSDSALTWHITGNLIVVSDKKNVPRPDLSFGVSRKLRRSLTAVPRATAVA